MFHIFRTLVYMLILGEWFFFLSSWWASYLAVTVREDILKISRPEEEESDLCLFWLAFFRHSRVRSWEHRSFYLLSYVPHIERSGIAWDQMSRRIQQLGCPLFAFCMTRTKSYSERRSIKRECLSELCPVIPLHMRWHVASIWILNWSHG
jgi:hypothetical protein